MPALGDARARERGRDNGRDTTATGFEGGRDMTRISWERLAALAGLTFVVLYVAAFGSSKIGVFSTQELEADTFAPDESAQIRVSGGGPSGLALDEARGRLYVLTRFEAAHS